MLVQLPTDNTEMVLALWDPIVLAALLGNPSDTSLYVTGPILTRSQREAFLVPINSWWYSARDGDIHQLVPNAPTPTPPLTAQTVTAKNNLILKPVDIPKGSNYIGIHIYPDETAEFNFSTDNYPQETPRGKKLIDAIIKRRTSHAAK